MRRLYIGVVILFSGLITFSQTYNQNVEDLINQVDLDSLVYYLRNLSGEDAVVVNGEDTVIAHRVSNWGNDLAAEYLKETLEGFGLTTTVQEYSGSGKNIYAVQEGKIYPDEYVMICAHYDAVDYYCADDNGSGSAGVLEAARLFSDNEFEYSIIYALWDEEEIGLIGSGYYAAQAASNGDVIHAVINMDMISWDGDDDMAVEIHSSFMASSNVLADYIVAVNDLYDLQLVPSIELPGTSASDHSKFWNNGFAAALIIEEYYGGDFNPYYHSEEDRIAILNMPYFHEMAKLAIGVLASKAAPHNPISISINETEQIAGIQLNNYPNPFTRETTVNYFLQNESFVRMSMVNSLGKEIKTMVESIVESGNHQFQLQAEGLPEGMYFLFMQTPKGTFTHKMLIK